MTALKWGTGNLETGTGGWGNHGISTAKSRNVGENLKSFSTYELT